MAVAKPDVKIRKYGPITVKDYGAMFLYDIKQINSAGEIVIERRISKACYLFEMMFEDRNGDRPFWQLVDGKWVDQDGLSWHISYP